MLSIENLEKELKTGKLNNLYILYGEELFLLESSLKKIKNLFGECVKGINYITIDENNVQELMSDIETPAFGYEKKLIIVRNTGLLKKEGRKKNTEFTKLREKIKNYIEENIEIIRQSIVVVFIEEEIDTKFELVKIIDKLGIICNFEFQKPAQLEKRIKAICAGYEVQIDDITVKYFIECCGTNMQELINEIRKLIEYVSVGGKIEKEDIDKLSIKKLESVIFDLTDSLGKKDTRKALDVLRNLVYAKEPIQKILITLYNHFRKIYLVKLSLKYNKDVTETLDLKPNQVFLVNKYRTQAKYFEEKELRNILQS